MTDGRRPFAQNARGKPCTGIFWPAYEARHDSARLRTQREVIRDVMLSAVECGPEGSGWLTLRELAAITRYGEASISAQLRHLRKPAFGGHVVEKRRRGEPGRGVWEYRLGARKKAEEPPMNTDERR